MKSFLGALLLTLLTACQSVSPAIQNGETLNDEMKKQARELVEEMSPAVVSVYGSGHSSGLIFDQQTVMTVAHGRGDSNVVQSEAGRFSVAFFRAPPYLDLALLQMNEPLTRFPLKIKEAKRGEKILILARTANGALRVVAGQVLLTAIDLPPSFLPQDPKSEKPRYLVETLILDAPAQPGDSGAPVFKLNGDLVGMVVAGNPALGLTLATSADAILKEVTSTKRDPNPYKPIFAAGENPFKTLADELLFIGRSLEEYGKQIGKHDPKRLTTLVRRTLSAAEESPLSRRTHLFRFWRAYIDALEAP